jgi:hypothetical protein
MSSPYIVTYRDRANKLRVVGEASNEDEYVALIRDAVRDAKNDVYLWKVAVQEYSDIKGEWL